MARREFKMAPRKAQLLHALREMEAEGLVPPESDLSRHLVTKVRFVELICVISI